VVFGEGLGTSGLLLLGEAPGVDEDRVGRPFVGWAGRVLDGLLLEVGLSRAESFIMNTVLCHPPGNRDPVPSEVDACAVYFDAQLTVTDPRVIVTLGLIPLRRLLGSRSQVERDHGGIFAFRGRAVVPTFHPSSLHWRAGRRDAALQDLRTARGLVAG
jgi:DNA polymerase